MSLQNPFKKSKKIGILVLSERHRKYLTPIGERLSSLGADVLYLTAEADEPLELDLIDEKVQWKFITDFLPSPSQSEGFILGWSKYIVQITGLGLMGFGNQVYSIISILKEFLSLENYVKVEKPDMMIALHERNRWGKMIGYHCKQNNIPYVTFQEGDYHSDRYSFGTHTQYSTIDLLWGQETYDKLLSHGCDESKMKVVGNTFIDELVKKNKETKVENALLFIVDLSWSSFLNPEKWKELLNTWDINTIDKIYIKWHPNTELHGFQTVKEMFAKMSDKIEVILIGDTYELIAKSSHVIILGYTTVAIEALALGKCIYSIPPIGAKESKYIDLGIAVPFNKEYNLREFNCTDIQVVQKYLTKFFYKIDGHVVDRCIEEMEKIL